MLRYVLDTLPFPWALRTLTQVADSAVGRWFRLEGSGHPREREGSRFMVSCLRFKGLSGAHPENRLTSVQVLQHGSVHTFSSLFIIDTSAFR